jgi:hypothetical protein
MLRCTRKLPSRHTTCGSTLDADGRCERCIRRAAGLCWSCGAPRSNSKRRGLLCRGCAAAEVAASQARYAAREDARAARRERAAVVNQRPDVKARRARLLYAWRHADPERLRTMAAKARALYTTRVQHPTGATAPRGSRAV